MPPTDILVFGEDDNDRFAMAHLVRALSPADSKAKITRLRKPIILARDASKKNRAKMSDEIASFVRAYQKVGKSVTVIVHRDCDAIEPAHTELADSLENEISAAGVESFVPATPAWEIESWWMLFPKAIEKVCSSWKKVDYGSKWVGQFTNAKERLIKDLRPTDGGKYRDFREADGIRIAEVVSKDPSHISAIKARSDSFMAFKSKLESVFKK